MNPLTDLLMNIQLQEIKMLNRDLAKREEELEKALKELKDYKAITKITLNRLQSQLQKENE